MQYNPANMDEVGTVYIPLCGTPFYANQNLYVNSIYANQPNSPPVSLGVVYFFPNQGQNSYNFEMNQQDISPSNAITYVAVQEPDTFSMQPNVQESFFNSYNFEMNQPDISPSNAITYVAVQEPDTFSMQPNDNDQESSFNVQHSKVTRNQRRRLQKKNAVLRLRCKRTIPYLQIHENMQLTDKITQIINTFPECINSKEGSLFVQDTLKSAENFPKEVDALFALMRDNVWEISASLHGNFVIQAWIKSHPDSVAPIINAFKNRILEASVDKIQCRIIQRLIESCSINQMKVIIQKIINLLPTLITKYYGKFVVFTLFMRGTDDQVKHVINAFIGRVSEAAKHQTQRFILREIIKTCRNDDLTRCLIEEIIFAIPSLVSSNKGCSVVKALLMYVTYEQYDRCIPIVFAHCPADIFPWYTIKYKV